MSLSAVILATILLGFAPPILWLWFWLKEDVHPEPKSEIILVFSFGMAAVLAAFLAEWLFMRGNVGLQQIVGFSGATFQIGSIIGFAFIEEIAKVGVAFFTALRTRYFDEPIDAMIYVITASLGFAALENALFISQIVGDPTQVFVVGAFRFANAVLIHASTGAIIGAAFAFSFCNHARRIFELVLALFFATGLHALYNFFILQHNAIPGEQVNATIVVASGALIALVLFERAKRLRAECGI